MADIDIDALLPPLTIAWRGREWTVNRGLPLSRLAAIKEEAGELDASNPEHLLMLVAGMFSVPSDELRTVDPSREELLFILTKIAEHFGMSPGESLASSATSAE